MTLRARAYPPRVPGRMNRTEAAYADHLEVRRLAGEIASWRFEEIGLRLANGCFYYPDFWVILSDGKIEVHEVKALRKKKTKTGFERRVHFEDDALVKWKTAAESFTEFRFLAVYKGAMGNWEEMEYQA